ncbi:FG-GAP-like repeat-containing protein, partial [Candidatus Kryptobacter tengchongensis]
MNRKIKIADDPVVSLIASDSMWFAVSKRRIKTEFKEWNFNVDLVSSGGIDLKGNGEIEIIVALSETGEVIILNTQTGAVKQVQIQPSLEIYTSPAIADLNLDGFPDIIITAGNKIWAFNYFGSVLF